MCASLEISTGTEYFLHNRRISKLFSLALSNFLIGRIDEELISRRVCASFAARTIGGLRWIEEPEVLRFFFGRLKEIGHWQEDLVEKFCMDFGDSL